MRAKFKAVFLVFRRFYMCWIFRKHIVSLFSHNNGFGGKGGVDTCAFEEIDAGRQIFDIDFVGAFFQDYRFQNFSGGIGQYDEFIENWSITVNV